MRVLDGGGEAAWCKERLCPTPVPKARRPEPPLVCAPWPLPRRAGSGQRSHLDHGWVMVPWRRSATRSLPARSPSSVREASQRIVGIETRMFHGRPSGH